MPFQPAEKVTLSRLIDEVTSALSAISSSVSPSANRNVVVLYGMRTCSVKSRLNLIMTIFLL